LLGTILSWSKDRRTAHENPGTARRLADAGGIERADDFHAPDSRNPLLEGAGLERIQHLVGFRMRPGDEGDADLVGTRRDLDGDVLETAVDCRDRRSLQLVDGLHVLLAADLRREHLGAIDCRDQRVLVLHAAHVAGDGETADIQLVVAIGGKQVLDQQSAPRAQGQALDVRALIDASRRPVGRAGRFR